MPLKLMTTELRNKRQSRTALFGPPNSFKTTSVLQTACYPLVIISPPGEEGFCTIQTLEVIRDLR